MVFTAGNSTTDWHSLEIGLAAAEWFILIIYVVLKAAHFMKQMTHVQSPKKIFMDVRHVYRLDKMVKDAIQDKRSLSRTFIRVCEMKL